MMILEHTQISQIITRLSYQIAENNFEEDEIYVVGINNNGSRFATLLTEAVRKIKTLKVNQSQVRLNPAEPHIHPPQFQLEMENFHGKSLLILDDVANTGRTLLYAMAPLLNILPKKIEVAVLVDRKHKMFPINVNYVGLSLATTLKENIRVTLTNDGEHAVFLE